MKNIFKLINIFIPLLFFLFTGLSVAVNAQNSGGDIEVRVLTPEQNRIDMDIRTSSLFELAAWCRSLGLSEAGTSSDLSGRLRSHYNISAQDVPPEEDKRKIITIESARTTEYFKIQEIDEDYARLTGEVRISLKDGDAVHRIKAWNILFNRTRNTLTASGGVEYIKEDGDTIETFRGESITVNIDNWSSIFLGGVSERSLQSDDTTYMFKGTVISRDDEEVILLKKASISNAKTDDPMWSLNATRLWLLPGSDFAVFNAVLKVGEIPVLYIPFFYFPADEIVFHPVIGSRTREGSYVQTTTYILGRPKADTATQSSLTKILGNSGDMEKRREGMFLRSTGKKVIDQNAPSLKLMVDYYANLGSYFGLDLGMPAKGILGTNDLSLGLGFTRTIAETGGSYTPFFPDYDGSSDWNKSKLLSFEVPFRYRFKAVSSIRGQYGSFSWNFPYYSDPFVDNDFLNRAEDMDWVNMIQQGVAGLEEETDANQLGAYIWQLSGQLTPSFPSLSPYISSVSINALSSTVSFRTVDTRNTYSSNDIKRYSPSSFFYAPDTSTIYSFSGSMSGNLLSLGGGTGRVSSNIPGKELDDPLRDIGVPRSPFTIKENDATAQQPNLSDRLVPPALTQRFDMPRTGNIRFGMDYQVSPTSSSTLKFDSNKWKEYNDISWSDISSIISNFGGTASTTYTLNHSTGLFSNSFVFSGSGTWRQYSFLNEEAEDFVTSPGSGVTDPIKVSNAKEQEYRQSFFSTSYGLTTSIRPLYFNSVFGASNLQYNLRGLAVKSNFLKMDGDNPDYELIYGGWEKDKIDEHRFSTNLSASVMDKMQLFTFSADMPPRDTTYSFNTTFNVWISTTTASWRLREQEEIKTINQERITEKVWKYDPFNLTHRLNFGTFGNFSMSLVMDTEDWYATTGIEKKLTSLTYSLNLAKWGLTTSYTMSRMLGYEFTPDLSGIGGTWDPRPALDPVTNKDNNILRPRDLTVNFSKNFSIVDIWKKQIHLSVTPASRLYFDLQRYTNSSLTFSLGFTIGINNFLDLTLATNSDNTVIYRYFQKFFPSGPEIPNGQYNENNFFVDLLNSFRFDDENRRKISGFKMKGFKLSAVHHMGDWNATLNWSMAPYRTNSFPPTYEMNNEVSFLLQWIPINEIKSDITYNKRNDEWIVKQ